MTVRSLILLLAMTGVTATAFGSSEQIAVVKERDLTLQSVINRASYVTGKKYYTTVALDKKVSIVNLDINRENADKIISSLLHQNNLIRVKESSNLFKIIPAKDIKFAVVPSVEASRKDRPALPKTYDFYLLKYKVANKSDAQDLSREISPYLSEYGQLVHANTAGEIIVKDNANNLAKIYRVLKKSEKESQIVTHSEREKEFHVLEDNNGNRDS
jgi:hypothetical protein